MLRFIRTCRTYNFSFYRIHVHFIGRFFCNTRFLSFLLLSQLSKRAPTSFLAPQRPIRTVLRQFTDWGRLLRINFFFSFSFSPFLHSGAVLSCVCWLSATTTTTEGKERQAANARATNGGKEWNGRRREMRCEAIGDDEKKNYTAQPSSEYVAFVRFGEISLSSWVLCEWKTYLKMRHVNTSRTVKEGWWCFHAQSVDVYRVTPGLSGDSGALSLVKRNRQILSSLTKEKKLWFINYKCIGYLHYARSPPQPCVEVPQADALARKKEKL